MSQERAPVAVVTGGHPFDVMNFHRLMQAVCGAACEPYVQHLEEFATTPLDALRAYRAVIFYFFPLQGPLDGLPGQAGHPRAAIEAVIAGGAGLLVLHHALLAYPGWDRWDSVVGCSGRARFSYHPQQRITVMPTAAVHPITDGQAGWSMSDETYVMPEPEGTPLLATDHAASMRTIGWTRQCGDSRVVCLQSGHDQESWSAPGLRRFLARGLRWSLRHEAGAPLVRLEAPAG
jgi:hypothetical protein